MEQGYSYRFKAFGGCFASDATCWVGCDFSLAPAKQIVKDASFGSDCPRISKLGEGVFLRATRCGKTAFTLHSFEIPPGKPHRVGIFAAWAL